MSKYKKTKTKNSRWNNDVKYKKTNKKNKQYNSKKYTTKKTNGSHKFWTKYYIDSQGNYVEKPWWANFWRVGFLDDIPTRADYEREMDGKVYYEPYDKYGNRKSRYGIDSDLYGLERLQMSLNRLWNGSPREWLKLIYRVLLLIGFCMFVIYFGRLLLGVPSDIPLFEAKFSDIGSLWK